MNLQQIFNTTQPIIGVVHLLPLPTSARWGGSLNAIIDRAEQEAVALVSGGVDGIVVENFFDAPFPKSRVDPAVVSVMTTIVMRLMELVSIPIGINVLRNDSLSAMAIASCTGASVYSRQCPLWSDGHRSRRLIEGCAHELLRYRRELGSDVKIMADVLGQTRAATKFERSD